MIFIIRTSAIRTQIFFLLATVDTSNPSILSLIRVLRGRGSIFKIWLQTLAFFSLVRVLKDRGAILKIWGLS
jgi:predicted pyridoxine 5'-phosphate oxidase superfamily flavin-nucleotide-binding protein